MTIFDEIAAQGWTAGIWQKKTLKIAELNTEFAPEIAQDTFSTMTFMNSIMVNVNSRAYETIDQEYPSGWPEGIGKITYRYRDQVTMHTPRIEFPLSLNPAYSENKRRTLIDTARTLANAHPMSRQRYEHSCANLGINPSSDEHITLQGESARSFEYEAARDITGARYAHQILSAARRTAITIENVRHSNKPTGIPVLTETS